MQFAAVNWLAGLVLIPLLWAAIKAADRRADRRTRLLLGPQAERLREGWRPRLRGWQRFLYLASLAWLILALARPQWGASEVSVVQRGHDVVIALDVSRSMLAQDVAPSRLDRAKAELTAFLRRQAGARVGLVLFAGEAFVQCPLTSDLATAEVFLQAASPEMISAQGTALVSALRISRELLASGRRDDEKGGFQAILLVTDGEDFEGDWEQDAHHSRREGIVIIPVGIGEESGGLIPLVDDQGRSAGFLRDAEGNLVLSRLDLSTLERLAAISGVSTFRVGIDGLAGERLRAVLDRLGTREMEQRQVTRWQERFVWPLALAFLHLGLAVAIGSAAPAFSSVGMAVLLVGAFVAAPGFGPSEARADQLFKPDWAGQVERGREAYAQGDFAAALRAFELARAQEPGDPRLALAVGAALHQLGRHEEALREFERARQLSARRDLQAESLFNSGTAALAHGDVQTAIDHLRRSLMLEPDRADALHNLETALLLMQEEQHPPDQEPGQNNDDGREQDGSQDRDEDPEQQDDSHEGGDTDTESDAERETPDIPELDREQALRMLQALDRDDQEIQRALKERLSGPDAQSGKEW